MNYLKLTDRRQMVQIFPSQKKILTITTFEQVASQLQKVIKYKGMLPREGKFIGQNS